MQDDLIKLYPSFERFATTMVADLVESFILRGSSGVLTGLYAWLPMYARWVDQMQEKMKQDDKNSKNRKR